MGLFMYGCAPSLIRLMGAEGAVADLAATYLRLCALFSPMTTITFALDNYLRICGFIRGSMVLNIFMSVLQIILLIALVAVCKFGLVGSCIAINAAMAICSVIALVPFVRGRAALKFVKPKFEPRMLRQIAALFVDQGDAALVVMSVRAFKLFSLKFFLRWFGFSAQSFFNAIEKPKYSTVLTMSAAIVFSMLFVALLWPLGLDGLWLNQAAVYIPVDIIACFMLRKVRKNMKKV